MLKKIKKLKKEIKTGKEETDKRKAQFEAWEKAGSPGLTKKK